MLIIMETAVLVLVALLVLLGIYMTCKSKFAETVKTTPMEAKTDSITEDTVLIFIAPWCGHCKSAMPEFIKASEMSDGKVILINSDDPKNKKLMEKHSVRGFPTIKKANGTEYKGGRTSEDIKKFADKK
jgi:thiol-disulfide isomerase/thioredoxin